MLKNRVIPCLLLSKGGLVKTTRFAYPKYVGDPINAMRIFNEKEVDELLVLDITATKERTGPNYRLIEQFAGECFMPLAYGGGIRSVEQARQLFALGVEKICLQTAALEDPSIITRIAERFGNQSIMVSIDVKRSWLGRPKLYHASAGKVLPQLWQAQLRKVVEAGAGEIVLNAVDRDGRMKGMDLELIREATSGLAIPLVAVGGVGSLSDIGAAVNAGASAVAVGSFFVFHGPHRAVLITYPTYRELEDLLTAR